MNRSKDMNKEIARAHMDTMFEWAELHKQAGYEGSSETAFLLTKAGRHIAKAFNLTAPNMPPAPREPEAGVEELRPG